MLSYPISHNMADRYILRGGSKKINKDVQIPNFIFDCNQIDCRDITYDGERFKWTSGWETLRNFIEHNLKLIADGLRRVAALESLRGKIWI